MNEYKLTVVEGAQIIAELAPIAIDLALKLQTLFANMNVQTSLTTVTGEEAQADNDTITAVNNWAQANNLVI